MSRKNKPIWLVSATWGEIRKYKLIKERPHGWLVRTKSRQDDEEGDDTAYFPRRMCEGFFTREEAIEAFRVMATKKLESLRKKTLKLQMRLDSINESVVEQNQTGLVVEK